MTTERKTKWNTFNVEFVSNGFVVERRGYNPYGRDPNQKEICSTIEQVINHMISCTTHNSTVDAEEKARLEAEKNAQIQ